MYSSAILDTIAAVGDAGRAHNRSAGLGLMLCHAIPLQIACVPAAACLCLECMTGGSGVSLCVGLDTLRAETHVCNVQVIWSAVLASVNATALLWMMHAVCLARIFLIRTLFGLLGASRNVFRVSSPLDRRANSVHTPSHVLLDFITPIAPLRWIRFAWSVWGMGSLVLLFGLMVVFQSAIMVSIVQTTPVIYASQSLRLRLLQSLSPWPLSW